MEEKKELKFLRGEIERWRKVPAGQRLEYFRSYYLKETCIFVFLVICLIFFIRDIRESRREMAISGLAINREVSQEGRVYFTSAYLSVYEGGKRPTAFLTQEYLFPEPEQELDQYKKVMAISAQVAAGQLDYLILDEKGLDVLKGTGIFTDVREFLEEEDLQRLEESLRPFSMVQEEGFLSLSGTPLEKYFSQGQEGSDLWLAFSCLPKRYEKAKAFLEYLLDTGKS